MFPRFHSAHASAAALRALTRALDRPRAYWLSTVIPVAQLCAFEGGLAASMWVPCLAFLVIPSLDLLCGSARSPWGKEQLEEGRTWDLRALPYLLVVLHVACVVLGASRVARSSNWTATMCWLSSVGLCTGFGLNAAHALGHRREAWPRAAGQLMTLAAAFMHMPQEHAIHHGLYGTLEDHGTPRPGESLYRYALRFYVDGFRHFWSRESRGLSRSRRRRNFFWAHRGPRSMLLPVALCVALSVSFSSPHVAWYFFGQAIVGTFMMALGNYIAHYGMLRRRFPDGSYAPGGPHLAWNCRYRISNFVLLGLPRHSDHHQHPSRATLFGRDWSGMPVYPLPYSCMAILSIFPPLWRRVMDPALRMEATRHMEMGCHSPV